MDIVLIPGMWLDASSWDDVTPALAAAGHQAHPVTLPGLEPAATDRGLVSLADQVATVVALVDSIPAERPVMLVGHSAAAAIAHAAVDARPDRVARAVYIGGFPAGDGEALVDGMPSVDGGIPLPDWEMFDDSETFDLDEADRQRFRARAIPHPERAVLGPQRLYDERRYDVPVTMICPEFTPDQLRGWMAAGEGPVVELTRIHDVSYVDIDSGHWPQLTRPTQLAAIIVAEAARS
jgi:pimeloyl-ACP methyl ester carboxylesterase